MGRVGFGGRRDRAAKMRGNRGAHIQEINRFGAHRNPHGSLFYFDFSLFPEDIGYLEGLLFGRNTQLPGLA
jgi:hypothetical protein